MNRIGLVLGGGGITGAAYELAALMAIELATGWHPNDAEIVVGTSAGASVAAAVRADRLDIETLVRPDESSSSVADRIRSTLYRRGGPQRMRAWMQYGVAAGLRNPGLTFALGSPAPFDAGAVADWVRDQLGSVADTWPDRPTAMVAYDVRERRRIAFGTTAAPPVTMAEAVAASSAIPLLFKPYELAGHLCVDGGVASGTHADLVLGVDRPLDLVIVLPPLAQPRRRRGAALYEPLFDKAGAEALRTEMETIGAAWPGTKFLVLRPPAVCLDVMRPNPMDPNAAVPTFTTTLQAMKDELARPDVWPLLAEHLSIEAGAT